MQMHAVPAPKEFLHGQRVGPSAGNVQLDVCGQKVEGFGKDVVAFAIDVGNG